MQWFKEKLAGPLIMFVITALCAGVWTLVVIATSNQKELEVRTKFMEHAIEADHRHDATDQKLASSINLLTNIQLQIRLDMADNKAEIKMLKREIEAIKGKT